MAEAAVAVAEVKYRMKDGKPVLDEKGNKIPVKPQLFKKLAQFQTPDGKIFETQREASEHLRRHLVVDAIKKIAAGDEKLVNWLMDNKEAIVKAYDAAKVERAPVTEETKRKMALARAKIGQGKQPQAATVKK